MSSYTTQAVYLVCDGCQDEYGGTGRYRTSMEVHAAAYADGWRYPAALTKNGTASTVRAAMDAAAAGYV